MAPPSSPKETETSGTKASSPPTKPTNRVESDGEGNKRTKTPRKATAATGTAAARKKNNKARLRQELHDLHQEMEVAHYGRQDKTGNLRRVIPRHKSGLVTAQRQSLEQQDRERHALHETSRKLLRKATINAMEQAVQKSVVFGDEEEEDDEEEDEPEEEEEGEQESSSRATSGADRSLIDPDEEGEEEEDEGEGTTKRKSQRISRRGRHKAKKMVRLRAFKSQRLAQREGEAIALHIQGRHLEAIDKLKEIAVDKPSAPQVYSCLGTVYEAMFDEAAAQRHQDFDIFAGVSPKDVESVDPDDAHSAFPAVVRKQIELATKAYGSFHVAAILYKKDYALWVRAADLSTRLADLYGDVLTWPDMPGKLIDLANKERRRWLLEAKNDYHAAENLRPPGINVGCKLARVYFSLGSLSEAFTLLTEMKGRKNQKTGRKEFDASCRAWMLYAELNLQIGYECEQWKREDFSNNDYVFRRWLRKYAVTFDWRERTIQALTKALEAGAGTKTCREILDWLKGRAGVANSDSTQNNSSTNAAMDADEDEELLAEKQANELANFDRTTSEMNLPKGSKAAELREKERANIVVQTNQKLPNGAAERTTTSANQSDHVTNDPEFQHPLSASVSTVINICTRLMHLLLSIGAYEGCYLVGEAASSYLKERFRLFRQQSDRISVEKRHDSVLPETGAPYDILTAGCDDDDSVVMLSDDEELLHEKDEAVLVSMEKGILPPIILTLYGIALLAAGRRKFLALKCIRNIQHTSLEEKDLFENTVASETRREASLSIFNEKYIQVPGRFTLFVLLSRTILSSDIHDRAAMTSCIELLEGMLDCLWSMKIVPSYQVRVGGSNSVYLEKLRGIEEMATTCATCLCRLLDSTPEKDGDALKRLCVSVKRTTQISCSLWNIDRDGCLADPKSRTALKTVSEALQILIRHEPSDLMEDLMSDILLWLSRFCFSRADDFCNLIEESATAPETATLPIGVEWLTAAQSKLSTRCYNLVVSSAVDSFSGWNERAFTMNLLRFSDRPKYAGLIASDGRVSGHMCESMRRELANQWTAIHSLNPRFKVSEEVSKRLHCVETTDWYRDRDEYFRELESAGFVSRQCEMEALWICLFFSRVSIIQAQSSQTKRASQGHVCNAMSVLLPLSQYVLNERLWGSRVGIVSSGTEVVAASTADAPVAEKRQIPKEAAVIALPPVVATPTNTQPFRQEDCPTRKRKRQASQTKPKSPFFRLDSESDEFLLTNLIKLTSSSFQVLWKSAVTMQPTFQERNESDKEDTVSSAMASLNEKIRLLRSCFSLMSVQRASLEIASDLLAVAAHPSCSNSYLAINHAANFASKGLRGGNSDRFFKNKLPGERATPLEMLLVLGRADCLNAIGFPEEASFLVSFVASECSVRRNQPGLWNSRWRFVSIYAYNLSVLVRVNEAAVFGNAFEWQQSVIQELSRARDDGIKKFGELQASSLTDDGCEEDGHDIDRESSHSKEPKSIHSAGLPTVPGRAKRPTEQPMYGVLNGEVKQIVYV